MVSINEKAHRVATEAYAVWHGPDVGIAEQRAGFDAMLPRSPVRCHGRGVYGRWLEAPDAGPTVVLYLHGGGVLGSSYVYRDLASRISRAARARVFVADFALAPESPFPTAFDQTRAAYTALVGETGIDPTDLVIAGDSAGAGMAIAFTASLSEWDLPRPACVVGFGPFADMTISGESMTTLAGVDPLVTRAAAEQMSAAYLAGHDPADPKVSAVFAEFTGFPPLLLDAGECEVLVDDSRRIAQAVESDGRAVELRIAEGMVHVYQMWAEQLPEAQ
ncbi:alpha/beta hydrolase [Mycobacterium syngnathidarum]